MIAAVRAGAIALIFIGFFSVASLLPLGIPQTSFAYAKDHGADHQSHGGAGPSNGSPTVSRSEDHGASSSTSAPSGGTTTPGDKENDGDKDGDRKAGRTAPGSPAAGADPANDKDIVGRGQHGKGNVGQRVLASLNAASSDLAVANSNLAAAEAAVASATTPEQTAAAKQAVADATNAQSDAQAMLHDAEAEAAERLTEKVSSPVTAATVTELAASLGIALVDPTTADAVAALAALEKMDDAGTWHAAVTSQ